MSRALRLTPTEALDLRARAAGAPSALRMRDKPVEHRQASQKYGNERVTDAGVTFASKAEHKRWQYLSMLERAGEIHELRLQVPFELIPSQVSPSGKRERPTCYLADFTYRDRDGFLVVEDVKGAVTPEFRLKRKLMLWRHGIEVREVRS